MPINKVYLADCMDIMRKMPDKSVDLCIVDPPYGIGESGGDKQRNRGYNRIVVHEKKEWDKETPSQEYFNELMRISKNQIIWGANYFIDKIKIPSMGWIFWDKRIGGDFSDGELAWTSFHKALRMFSYSHVGDTRGGIDRIHPTQKPVPLYKWLLKNYANPNDKIFDSHVGSGSIRIACHDMGFDFEGCEIDKDYWEAQEKRYNQHAMQGDLFSSEDTQKAIYQEVLF
jgi:site-specific DNA-methyltransferase (adenine-specific)